MLDAPCYPDFIGDAYAAMSVFSISTAIAPIDWKAARINVLDAPCYPDFIGDAYAAMSVCETALFVVDAAEDLRLARAVFVNRVDKENADFEMCLDMLRERVGMRLGAVTLPWGTGEDFDGIIDLVRMKARHCDGTKQTESEIPEEYREMCLDMLRERFGMRLGAVTLPWGTGEDFDGIIDLVRMKARHCDGTKHTESEIPEESRAPAEAAHETLWELVAEADDALMEKYLEGEPLTQEEVESLLAQAIAKRLFVPVFAGSCVREQGVNSLMDDIATYFPAPTDYGEMPLIDGPGGRAAYPGGGREPARQGHRQAPVRPRVRRFLREGAGRELPHGRHRHLLPRPHRLRRDAAHRRRHPQDLLGGRAPRGLRLQDAERPAAGPSLLPQGARRHHRAGHGAGERPHTKGRAPPASLRDVRPRDERGGSCLPRRTSAPWSSTSRR